MLEEKHGQGYAEWAATVPGFFPSAQAVQALVKSKLG